MSYKEKERNLIIFGVINIIIILSVIFIPQFFVFKLRHPGESLIENFSKEATYPLKQKINELDAIQRSYGFNNMAKIAVQGLSISTSKDLKDKELGVFPIDEYLTRFYVSKGEPCIYPGSQTVSDAPLLNCQEASIIINSFPNALFNASKNIIYVPFDTLNEHQIEYYQKHTYFNFYPRGTREDHELVLKDHSDNYQTLSFCQSNPKACFYEYPL